MKKVELSELANDVNYAKYKEVYEKGSLEHLKERFVAYQNGMLVYIAHNKDALDMSEISGISEHDQTPSVFDKIAEKVKGIICKDPILIIKVGSDSLYYFKKD